MASQYDMPESVQKIQIQKTQRKLALREQFLKLKTDPFQHAAGATGISSGTVFDPAMMRFNALKVSGTDFFKPTPKTINFGMWMIVFPMIGFYCLLYKERYGRESAYRRGEVAYKDRRFKLA